MSADEGALFDAYSEQALRGDAPSPEQFLAAHPGVSAELRAALVRMFQRSPRGATNGALPFERLGEFRLVKRLGGGGMGIVFLAVQESLGREVALKILRPELQGSAVAAERFRREARALAELRHQNLVTIFGGGEEHGVRYLAMDLVPGDSLDEVLRSDAGGRLAAIPIAQRVRWVAGLARGLHHAHERGVVHRDVKPSNVRVGPDGCARLLDFGLARRHSVADGSEPTLTESFAGSPSYAAPEQIQPGGAIDPRTDVYALGVTLYQCLTGKLPYEGATVEQLFHRILAGTPVPPRRLAPDLPRDLELVTLKAMERRPEQRYATAAAFADDLEAVLELRTVSARPPGAIARARKLVRAHPLPATAGVTGLLAAIALVAIVAGQQRNQRRQRLEEAARLVSTAQSRVDDYRARRDALTTVQASVVDFHAQMTAQHFDDERYALLDRHEAQLEHEQRAWEETYYEVLDLLRQAERIDPNVQGTEPVRGELYFARYQEAMLQRDPIEAEFFRDLAARSDPRIEASLEGEVSMHVESDPPGAELHLFRFVEHSRLVEDGEPRMVAVPVQRDPPVVPPNRWALRVTHDFPPLRRGDHVFEIEGAPLEDAVFVIDGGGVVGSGERLVSVDGAPIRDDWDAERLAATAIGPTRRFELAHRGTTSTLEGSSLDELGITVAAAGRFGRATQRDAVHCRLVRDGEWLDAMLPPGAPVRTTARPVLAARANRAGLTPHRLTVPRGDYLLLLRMPEREEVRVAMRNGEPPRIRVRIPPLGEGPPGFVLVSRALTEPTDFWLMEHEVTSAQWRDFLRDPSTRERLASLGRSRYVPRMTGQPNPLWERDPDGTWTWPESSGWRGDWPVVGLSIEDATDYVAWRNQCAAAANEPWTYALPTSKELWYASVGGNGWSFVYGLRFRPRWSRSCFAHRHANLGPVLEFPVDESPFGVFDLTGGAFEWLDTWYDEPRGLHMVGGGAWGQATPERLRVESGIGLEPGFSTGETGLRLLARRRDPETSPPESSR